MWNLPYYDGLIDENVAMWVDGLVRLELTELCNKKIEKGPRAGPFCQKECDDSLWLVFAKHHFL